MQVKAAKEQMKLESKAAAEIWRKEQQERKAASGREHKVDHHSSKQKSTTREVPQAAGKSEKEIREEMHKQRLKQGSGKEVRRGMFSFYS